MISADEYLDLMRLLLSLKVLARPEVFDDVQKIPAQELSCLCLSNSVLVVEFFLLDLC